MADTPRKAREREESAEAAKRRARKEAEATKLREAETAANETYRKIHLTVKERILNGKDTDVFVDPATMDVTMSRADADALNQSAVKEFVAKHPEHTQTSRKSLSVLGEYFDRNRVMIVSLPTLEAAFNRLREYGVIVDVTPEPTPLRRHLSPQR